LVFGIAPLKYHRAHDGTNLTKHLWSHSRNGSVAKSPNKEAMTHMLIVRLEMHGMYECLSPVTSTHEHSTYRFCSFSYLLDANIIVTPRLSLLKHQRHLPLFFVHPLPARQQPFIANTRSVYPDCVPDPFVTKRYAIGRRCLFEPVLSFYVCWLFHLRIQLAVVLCVLPLGVSKTFHH
jgi:hypothetical protein